MMSETCEKRRFPRLDAIHLISYTHFDDTENPDEVGICRSIDLSQGGVTIQTHRFFAVNSRLEMVIALEERLIRAKGKVVHIREVAKDLYDVGVCFIGIGDADQQALAAFFRKISVA
jgi:hypothetical protein